MENKIMNITLNGKKTDIDEGMTILDILEEKDVGKENIVIEYNGNFIKKKNWDTRLRNGDVVEIIFFAGGG
ncbi:MAG: sulfur carrier protein ThiS [Candidatus Muiribacteriota bacterium]